MRQIIIGDVHGCYDELLELLDKVGLEDTDLLVSVGDLVDRGPKSLEVCDFFRNRPNSVVLMGNHERKHIRGIRSYAQDIVYLQMGERYDDVVEWMSSFPYYIELDSALIVHAAFEHDVELANQREDVLAGTTSGARYLESKYAPERGSTDGTYWTDVYDGEKPIVFGHHVVGDEVKVWNDRVFGIDTGACHGGRLTAVVLPEFRIVQIDVARDYWVEQKRIWQPEVLKAKPWTSLSFEQIERELGRADKNSDPAVAAVATSVRLWLRQLIEAQHAIATAIEETVERLLAEHDEGGVGRAAAMHEAKGWLFRHERDAVRPIDIAEYCSSPSSLVALAASLKVHVATEPDFGTGSAAS